MVRGQDRWIVFYYGFLNGEEIAPDVGTVSGKVHKVVAEVSVEFDAKPFMIYSIVIDKELGGHLWVEEGTEDWILLALDGRHKGATICWEIADSRGHEHILEAGISLKLFGRYPPVVPVVRVVVISEEKSQILKLSVHLRVARVHDELERERGMSQVHLFVRVTVGCCEVRDLLETHTCTPKWDIDALIVE